MATAAPAGSLPELLREVLNQGQGFLPSGQRVPLQSNVSPAEAELLYQTVRQLAPLHSLEIGLAHGVSSVAILQALQDNGRGIHHVIDPFQHRYQNAGLALIDQAQLTHRLDFHQRFPEEVIPQLVPLDFVFIDSSHLFDLTLMEFVLADKKLTVGGQLALHDLWMPSMQSAARYILSNRAYRRVPTPTLEPPTPGGRARAWLARLLRRVPGSVRVLRPEVLTPRAFADGNLLLLTKAAEDTRDWRHHEPF